MTVTERVIAGLACAFFCCRAISAGLRGVYSGDGDPDVHLARSPAAFALTVISGAVLAVLCGVLALSPGR